MYVRGSVKVEADVKALVKTTLDSFGRLDYVVSNGGGQFVQAAADMTEKGWKAVMETNLTGCFLLCKEAYTAWMRDHGGAIVMITANVGRNGGQAHGHAGMAHTASARAGQDVLAKTLSVEWAPSQVRVNSVAPGIIFSQTAEDNYGEKQQNRYGAGAVIGLSPQWPACPAKRAGTVEEISSAVLYLLSPGAQYISG